MKVLLIFICIIQNIADVKGAPLGTDPESLSASEENEGILIIGIYLNLVWAAKIMTHFQREKQNQTKYISIN